jgi:hypothetical protein
LKLIVAARDWHPADHGSFATNHLEAILQFIGERNDFVPTLCRAARCRSQFDGDGPAFFPFAENMSILSEHERDNLRDNDGVVYPNAAPLRP